MAALPRRERAEQRHAGDAGDQRCRRGPAVHRSLDHGVGDRDQPGDAQHGADRVHPRRVLGAAGRHEAAAQPERQDDHRQVHQEDRAPREVVEQQSAGARPDRDAEARHAGPDPDRLRAADRVVTEDVGQDRQRRRHHERGAGAHERARRDQLACAARQRGETRRRPEDDQAGAQRTVPAVAVSRGAGDEQQAGEGERVPVDDPLQVRARRIEFTRERWKRRVDDRGVDDDGEQRQAQDSDDGPAGGRACGGHEERLQQL